MQEVPRRGSPSSDGRPAPEPRLFATFKLATPYVEMVQKRSGAGDRKTAANINRISLVSPDRS